MHLSFLTLGLKEVLCVTRLGFLPTLFEIHIVPISFSHGELTTSKGSCYYILIGQYLRWKAL